MLKPMYNYLQDKPLVGVVSGLGSGIVLKVQTMLTDEHILKVVSGLAAWAGMIVAFLTGVVWAIKLYDTIKVRIKIKKS
jgi:hypothetical protein